MRSFPDWFSRFSIGIVIGLLMLPAYIGCYAMLSAAGEYRSSPTGKLRYSFGLAVTDRTLWQPKGMYLSRRQTIKGEMTTDANLPGYFFAPLILLDRACWHPTVYYFEE